MKYCTREVNFPFYACVASNSWIETFNCKGWKGFVSSYSIYSAMISGNFMIIHWWIYIFPIFIAAHESTNTRKFWDAEGELWGLPIWNTITGRLLSGESGIGQVMGVPILKYFLMRVNRLFWRFDEWKVKFSGNAPVSKSIRLETSDDSSFLLQAVVLSV